MTELANPPELPTATVTAPPALLADLLLVRSARRRQSGRRWMPCGLFEGKP